MSKINLSISAIIVGACLCSPVFAAEFTPLNFEDAAAAPMTEISIASADTKTQPVKTQSAAKQSDVTGSKSMQSAITQLDNAQVEVRNELLNYKTKYSEIDAKYAVVKTERADLNKQIKACEKKIRQLDKAKEKIKKNMV